MQLLTLSLLIWAVVARVQDSKDSSSNQAPISLSLHITICPSKMKEEQSLLLTFLEQVKKNEPGVLEFELFAVPANNSFLTFEKYKNQAAIQNHLNTPWIKQLLANEQGNDTKCAPNEVLFDLDKVFNLQRQAGPSEP